MPENIPGWDNNLYDKQGRVKDVDAAQEMAEAEERYRDFDRTRLFRPGKKELAEREADLDSVGRGVLGEKRKKSRATNQG
jgi:hypothetical protein